LSFHRHQPRQHEPNYCAANHDLRASAIALSRFVANYVSLTSFWLTLAASPHDSHLLATFALDSNIIRILDHRQPGQALLELHGHSAPVNCIEWSPSRRGMLASGADDSQVLYWDLINSQNAATVSTNNGTQMGQPETIGANIKGPAASWRCDYEVGNISWSPSSQLTNQGGDWLGVTGGRAVWGVKV